MADNVRRFGAVGDGQADDATAIQAVLNGGRKDVCIPAGEYRIGRTLQVESFTAITADSAARIFLCGETVHGPGDFPLTNRDHAGGNAANRITGGVWDGNKRGNFKDPNLFNMSACTGTVLNFRNVRNLTLSDLVVANSAVYFIRMCMLDGFEIHNLSRDMMLDRAPGVPALIVDKTPGIHIRAVDGPQQVADVVSCHAPVRVERFTKLQTTGNYHE